MKKISAYLVISALLAASLYFSAGCGDNSVDSGNNDLGILRTDESGNILGGDYTDWCLRRGVDTLTDVSYPVITSSFGPAYPNPTSGLIKINFSLTRTDTISLYYLDTFDTLFFINNEVKDAGWYSVYIGNTYNLHHTQKRLYLKSKSIVTGDSCSLYGDIEYN